MVGNRNGSFLSTFLIVESLYMMWKVSVDVDVLSVCPVVCQWCWRTRPLPVVSRLKFSPTPRWLLWNSRWARTSLIFIKQDLNKEVCLNLFRMGHKPETWSITLFCINRSYSFPSTYLYEFVCNFVPISDLLTPTAAFFFCVLDGNK